MEVIFFDLDDTLIPSTKIYNLALNAIGIDPNDSFFLKAKADVKQRLGSQHVCNHSRALYFKRYLELQNNLSPKRYFEIISLYEEKLANLVRLEWEHLERLDLLKTLKSRFHLGIITNETTRSQMLKLNSMDPEGELFDVIVTSEEAGFEKPDRRLFQLALANLNVSPAVCWMVGDSLVNDVRPAQSLGWRTIWTQEFSDSPDATAVVDLNSLNSLLDLSM